MEKKKDFTEVETEEKAFNKKMISFGEEGVVISTFDLNTIEKDMRFVEKPSAHMEYGITINKGLIQSQFVKKTDLSMWYLDVEYRDEKWRKLKETLIENGVDIVEVK